MYSNKQSFNQIEYTEYIINCVHSISEECIEVKIYIENKE